jgi:hypothetical protein
VINNGIYGTIRMHQEREYPGRVSGTGLTNPDFAALARAYGGHGERWRKPRSSPAPSSAPAPRQAFDHRGQARSRSDHAHPHAVGNFPNKKPVSEPTGFHKSEMARV